MSTFEKSILDTMDIKSYINTSNFSDHDAIQFSFFKKDALM